jgi:hypothetical protein
MNMKKSNIILIIGLVVMFAGAVLSKCPEPYCEYADYVLIAGAVLVIARGFIRTHEKD